MGYLEDKKKAVAYDNMVQEQKEQGLLNKVLGSLFGNGSLGNSFTREGDAQRGAEFAARNNLQAVGNTMSDAEYAQMMQDIAKNREYNSRIKSNRDMRSANSSVDDEAVGAGWGGPSISDLPVGAYNDYKIGRYENNVDAGLAAKYLNSAGIADSINNRYNSRAAWEAMTPNEQAMAIEQARQESYDRGEY